MSDYKITIQIDNLKLFEQDALYRKIYNCLSEEQKSNISVKLTDSLGGQHYLDTHKGIMPGHDSYCMNCYEIECKNCKVYKEWHD